VAISADGNRAIIASQMDLAPPSDTDGTFELFLWDRLSGITRITSSNKNVLDTAVTLSDDGTNVAFTGKGNYDPLGTNSEFASEVFFYHTADPYGQILQLTDFSDLTFGSISTVSSDASGRWIAFDTGTAGIPGWPNFNHDREVVLIDRNAWVAPTDPAGFVFATQATGNCPDPSTGLPSSCDSSGASVNADASRIAFDSNASLTGGNADGNWELYLVKDCPTTGCVRDQLTSSPGPDATGIEPSIDDAGELIAFRSPLNLDSDPGDTDGNSDIFLWDGSAPSPVIRRVTLTASVPGDNLETNKKPRISGDGRAIAFFSRADLVPPGNTDGGLEVFIATPPNEPPVLDPIGPKSVNAGQLLTFQVLASDPNYDELTLGASSLPAGASFPQQVGTGNVSGTFSWTPPLCSPTSPPPVTFSVTDGEETAEEQVTITVQNSNCPPQLAVSGPTCTGDVCLMYESSPSAFAPISFTVTATDPNGVASLSPALSVSGKIVLNVAPSTPGATFTLNAQGDPNVLSGTYSWSQMSPGTAVSFAALGNCGTSYPVAFGAQGTDSEMGTKTITVELVKCGDPGNTTCTTPNLHSPMIRSSSSRGQVPDQYAGFSWVTGFVGLAKPFMVTATACDPDSPTEALSYAWTYQGSNPPGITQGSLNLQDLNTYMAKGTSPASVSQNTFLNFTVKATDMTARSSAPKSASIKVDPDCVTVLGKLTATCN